jgi:hypothetical protein
MLRLRHPLALATAAILWAAPAAYASYPADFAKAVTPCLRNGDFSAAEKEFLHDAMTPGRNQLLYLYELANLYRMKGDVDKSIELFGHADRVAHDYEGKALVSAGAAAGQVGATLTNDTVLTWEGDCQDKVMSRTLDAMNYLAKHDLEGARVEVRKAEEYQVQERAKRQKAVARAANLDNASANAKYGNMFSYVQDVRNSFENAFTYYLSSAIYRAQGASGLDDALVDIKRAYELAPRAPAVRQAYLDIVAQGGDPAALEELKARLGADPGLRLPDYADYAHGGTVVVIYEVGFVPPMGDVAIDVFALNKLYSLAFPIYNDFGGPQPPLEVTAPGAAQSTSLVADVRKLEVKSLQERIPGILARGTLGAIAKAQAQQKATNSFGIFGQLAATIATKLVTTADLRSWLSLPAEVQTAQLTLQPGPNDLTLASYGWTERVSVDVAPGSTTFLMVRSVPGFRTIKSATVKAGA